MWTTLRFTMSNLAYSTVLVFFLFPPFASSESVPCPFNPLCTCRHDITSEATCVSIPYTTLPQLPAGISRFTLTRTPSLLALRNATTSPSPDLTNLRITSTSLSRIESCAFCSYDLTSLDLSNNKLRTFPGRAVQSLGKLQWLNLRGNLIENLTDIDKVSDTLRSLHLSRNALRRIADRKFNTLRYLTVLDLNENNIFKIVGKPFPLSLLRVNLSGNLLESVPRRALSGLSSLAYLILSDNHIKELPSNWSLPTPRLETLDLSRNLISLLPERLLNSAIFVRKLDLGANFIQQLPSSVLRGIKLQALSLALNHLKALPDGCFEGLETTLNEVDLSQNYIESFPPALKALRKLKTLNLSGNRLAALDEYDLFTARDTLEAVDLSSNIFEDVPKTAIKFLLRLSRLNLKDNWINHIEVDDFRQGCERLTDLELSFNKIQTLPSDAFIKLTSLKALHLAFNPLTTLDASVFIPLRHTLETLDVSSSFNDPANFQNILSAELRRLHVVHASYNHIQSIPKHSDLLDLATLNLNDNAVTEVSPGTLNPDVYLKLKTIHLANNLIKSLPPETFYNLSNLDSIALSSNSIRSISSNSFRHLPRLQEILLDHNVITSLSPSSFDDLPLLAHVSFTRNKLEELDLKVFHRVGNFSHTLALDFSHNSIGRLLSPTSAFLSDDFTLHVSDLNLSHNKISSIPAGFFWSIRRRLFKVDLSHNRLASLSVETVSELPRIQVLYLNDNKIAKLSPRAFQAASQLQVLNLSGNSLNTVPSEAFAKLVHLTTVDLSRNVIVSLPEDAFDGTALQQLDLSGNKLVRPFTKTYLPIRSTFQQLDLSFNRIVVVAAFEFGSLYNVESLNLSSNKIVVLPENAFANLTRLQVLDLSSNPLWRVEPASLTPLTSLEALYLNNASLTHVPQIFTPELTLLSLRSNAILNLSDDSFVGVPRLREVDLAENKIQDFTGEVWKPVGGIRRLDISMNPIQILGFRNLRFLENMQELDIRGLDLRFLDARALDDLKVLRTVKANTYSEVRAFRLQELLSRSKSLRNIVIEILEATLSYQIQWSFTEKIQHIHIYGSKLNHLTADTLTGLHPHGPFTLRLGPTGLKNLPTALVHQLYGLPWLTLDLTDNEHLSTVQDEEESEENDETAGDKEQEEDKKRWKRLPGHRLLGSLHIGGVPWVCDCRLLWIKRWLQRQRITGVDGRFRTVHTDGDEPQCVAAPSQTRVPIIDLKPGTSNCALHLTSGGNPILRDHSNTVWPSIIGCAITLTTMLSHVFAVT
ncbi:chaoptin-like [Ornithodoros turicata]|uniref:chaoptin-like n=1 Tax=Ornithodoros turicata TaxID=34597 RepID=UPI003138CD66